jgi:nicotinamide mononucleotide transporter
MTLIEAIATFFGLIAVWLVVKRHILCWPTGLVQVTLYVWIFYEAKLYSDMMLHVIYIFLQLYGWWQWQYGGNNHESLPVTTLRRRSLPFWISAVATGTFLWGFVMANYTDAAAPFPDAFIAVASLAAQWLTAKKKVESWIFWIFVNIVAIGVYAYKALWITTGLYTVFLVMAFFGFRDWRKALSTPAFSTSIK